MDPAALERRCAKLSSILEIARALAVERDLDSLLAMVLQAAAYVAEADRCSMFLIDHDRGDLWTRAAQGMGRSHEIRTPLGVGIAGHVAVTGKAVNIPDAYADSRFNQSIDQSTGYRTKSILTVPLMRAGGVETEQVVGVLQALNRLDGQPFSDEDLAMLEGLGGQAAAAIDNAILHQEIQRLFEGFVHASVVAIESRDPTTAGHSERVAKLTVELARNLEGVVKGPWARQIFTDEAINEIRYAALLHDFGKVGVREHVLVKANKLYPHELEILESRFELVRRTAELESLKRQFEAQQARPADLDARLRDERAKLAALLGELDGLLEFIRGCNRPSRGDHTGDQRLVQAAGFEKLAEIATRTFPTGAGPRPYLTAAEVTRLSIPIGTLSAEERLEIESHVTHTYRFLSQIPWTRTLRRIPDIAYGHHEKLDGHGYPRGLAPGAIGVETRMLTISDIYDAVTASDRPYKKAIAHEKALDILFSEAKRGQIDADLLEVFVDAKVPNRILGLGPQP